MVPVVVVLVPVRLSYFATVEVPRAVCTFRLPYDNIPPLAIEGTGRRVTLRDV
jgi:hypothetical protein